MWANAPCSPHPCDGQGTNVERFVAERDIPYPVGLDNHDRAWEAWEVRGTPPAL
jgi:hypothetical protein